MRKPYQTRGDGGKSGLGVSEDRASNRDASGEPELEQRLETIPRYPDWSIERWVGG